MTDAAACTLVHGGKVGVQVAGVTTAAGYFLLCCGDLTQSLGVVCDIGDDDKHLHILLKRLNPAFGAADLSQIDAGQGVLQSVVLAVVGGLQRAKPRNLNIKVHLFFDHRVSGSQRLYLSVGERSLV